MCVCVVVVVVVVAIITLYLVQTGRFLATTGYVAPSPNHVQHNVHKGHLKHSVSPSNNKKKYSPMAQYSWAPQLMKSRRAKHS